MKFGSFMYFSMLKPIMIFMKLYLVIFTESMSVFMSKRCWGLARPQIYLSNVTQIGYWDPHHHIEYLPLKGQGVRVGSGEREGRNRLPRKVFVFSRKDHPIRNNFYLDYCS